MENKKSGIFFSFCIVVPRRIVMLFIKLYQHTLSFDHGIFKRVYPYGFCKFYPSCSQYGYKAFEQYGVVKGMAKTVWRLLRCNPWGRGGIDNP